jgi:hypothetical protein
MTRDREKGASPEMMPKREQIESLRDLLADSFTRSELQMFLELYGYGDAAESVRLDVSPRRYSFELVQALENRGLIDSDFFDRLARERPHRAALLRRLRESGLAGDKGDSSAIATTERRKGL